MSANEAIKVDPAGQSQRRNGEPPADATAGAQGQALRDRLAHLTRVLSLNDIAGLIAHEVSQPLGAMLLHANACQRWLAQDPPCIEKARAAAERIVRDGNRARTVVEAVRGITPALEPRLQPADLNAGIRDALDIACEQLAAHGIALECNYGSLPPVMCDPLQIVQVVLNLASNAIESMAASTAPRSLVVSSRADPIEGVVVEVRDSGAGLDASSENQIFTPLFTTKPGAIGLGLSNCRRIVEAHGGRLWATSNDDRGATFCFSIPLTGPAGVDAG
jgi:signal transduction histidine kinase